MSRALQLYPNNDKLVAMKEYANGHILRINRKGMDAIKAFQHAAALQPKWLDPYLGLARTYINNLADIERGTQALKQAQEMGHSFGKREMAMMAEASRARGLQAFENAKLMKNTDREKDYLQKAKMELDDALKTYLQISPYGNSTKQIVSIQDVLTQVEKRIQEVNPPNPLLPWNWGK
jgi:DNA-directed RNA polymerase subunit K/omega